MRVVVGLVLSSTFSFVFHEFFSIFNCLLPLTLFSFDRSLTLWIVFLIFASYILPLQYLRVLLLHASAIFVLTIFISIPRKRLTSFRCRFNQSSRTWYNAISGKKSELFFLFKPQQETDTVTLCKQVVTTVSVFLFVFLQTFVSPPTCLAQVDDV